MTLSVLAGLLVVLGVIAVAVWSFVGGRRKARARRPPYIAALGALVDGDGTEVEVGAELVLEEGRGRREVLEPPAAAAGGDVGHAGLPVDLAAAHRPGALVNVDVAVEDDVDMVFLVKRDEVAHARVSGSGRALPAIPEIVVVG